MDHPPPPGMPAPAPGDAYPSRLFATLTGYRNTAALKAALELDIFSAIGAEALEAAEIGRRCGAAERGIRILCNWLTVFGFLVKSGKEYQLSSESAVFLDRASDRFIADAAAAFLLAPSTVANYEGLAESVRRGGSEAPGGGVLASDNPLWIHFALGMAPTRFLQAEALAEMIAFPNSRGPLILDVSAGHGAYGIAFALRHPRARIVALDWAAVLEVAAENARRAGVADRLERLAGDAFELDWGRGFELIVIANFLHHFGRVRCVELLRKAWAALCPNGRVAIVDFVPDRGGVSPPEAAVFNLGMLASTAEGEAYGFLEHREMLEEAGFVRVERRPLPPGMQTAILAQRCAAATGRGGS